jgi:hypothetical protein
MPTTTPAAHDCYEHATRYQGICHLCGAMLEDEQEATTTTEREPTYPETLSCVAPDCLVNRGLCDANGLCGVHAHAHALEVEHYAYEGATLARLDPFQPTMMHSTRAGIFGAERPDDLSCALDSEDVGYYL